MKVFRKNIAKSRKQIRKESRLAKKAKKHEYFSNRGVKKVVSKTANDNPADNTLQAIIARAANDSPPPPKKLLKAKTKKKKSVSSLQDEFRMELIENDRQIKELDKEMQKERLMKLKEDNEAEEKEIRRLEKRLKLKKRSDKSISNFFAEDGLDYLLDVCDQKKLKGVVETEKNFKEDDSDFDDDYAKVVGMPSKRKEKRKPKVESGSDSDDEPEELTSRKGGYGKIQKIINTSTRETKTDKQEKSLESENDNDSEGEISDFDSELEGVGDESDSSSAVDNKEQKSKRKSEEMPVKGNKGKIDNKTDRSRSVKDKKTNPSRVFASESEADSSDVEMESSCSGSDNEERHSNVSKRKEGVIVKELKNEGGKVLQKKKVKVAKGGLTSAQIKNNFSDYDVSSLASGCDFDGTAAEPKKVTKGKKLKTMTPNQKVKAAAIIDADENLSSEDEVSSLENESDIIDTKKTVKATAKKDRKKVNVEPPIKKAKNIADEQPELDKVENPFSEDEVSSLGDDSEDIDSGNNQSNELWEDIYGRTRDKAGNVVSAYQPPQLRKKEKENADSEKVARLKKQMKGLLNRLAENNMVSISSQLENLYMSHSRNEMNETLWSLLRESLISETMAPERLVAEHAMLIAILGANIGSEVSAYCLQHCVTEWHQLLEDGPCVEDKRTNNVLLLLSYLYHFKLFHCTLLYDILELLMSKLSEKEMELVLLVLRTVGFTLRKDDPSRLKDFVVKVQMVANGQKAAAEGSRARFMLDTVLAIKNNNINKIPNYDPEYGERIKKSLRVCVRKGNYNAELKITLVDLLKADERGRWWVVGSAWTGEKDGQIADTPKKVELAFSSKLLELAKKQRMNTDTRRTIFCIIMSAEDYLDAFEKLLKMGLKGPSEREIMNVLLHCLLHEKNYNPYYAHLARKFCICDRRFQIMLQFAVWDKIQDLQSLSATSVTNLAKFLGFLILEKSLAISVLKVVHFAELDKPAVRFIRQVLIGILLADSEEAMVSAFGRIINSKTLKLFREGLRLFLHHFVLRNSKAVMDIDMALLTARVKLADSALSASERGLSFN